MTKRRALAGGIKGDWLNDRDPTVHLKSAHVRKRESLTAREGSWAQITLPSGEVRRIPAACRATKGAVGNADHMKIRLGGSLSIRSIDQAFATVATPIALLCVSFRPLKASCADPPDCRSRNPWGPW
jgi:Ribosomal Proteins L2, C-terminal domain